MLEREFGAKRLTMGFLLFRKKILCLGWGFNEKHGTLLHDEGKLGASSTRAATS
jgi:hypothetical protein